MQKSIALLISLFFLASCTMTGGIPDKAPQKTPQIELTPKKEGSTTSDITKNFGSGFILTQNTDQTTLSYSGKVIKIWSHTPPQKVPFIWDEACAIVYAGFEKLKETTEEGKQSVWDTLSEQEKKTCLADKLMETIDVRPTQNPRFFIITQMGYENVLRTIVDIQTMRTYGGIPSEVIQDMIQDIIFVDGHILFSTRSSFDASDEVLIFSENFEFQKKWTSQYADGRISIEKIENMSQTGVTLLLKDFNYTTSKESLRKEMISF